MGELEIRLSQIVTDTAVQLDSEGLPENVESYVNQTIQSLADALKSGGYDEANLLEEGKSLLTNLVKLEARGHIDEGMVRAKYARNDSSIVIPFLHYDGIVKRAYTAVDDLRKILDRSFLEVFNPTVEKISTKILDPAKRLQETIANLENLLEKSLDPKQKKEVESILIQLELLREEMILLVNVVDGLSKQQTGWDVEGARRQLGILVTSVEGGEEDPTLDHILYGYRGLADTFTEKKSTYLQIYHEMMKLGPLHQLQIFCKLYEYQGNHGNLEKISPEKYVKEYGKNLRGADKLPPNEVIAGIMRKQVEKCLEDPNLDLSPFRNTIKAAMEETIGFLHGKERAAEREAVDALLKRLE